MYKIICRRLLSALITLFVSTVVIFVLIRLSPGDPIELMLGQPSDLPITNTPEYEEKVKELRSQLGLDQNIVVQYIQWIKRLVTFDLGTSIYSGRPIGTEIAEKIPATIMLSIVALVIQLILGLLFGIISAIKAGKWEDNIIRIFSVIFASVPAFVIGLSLLSVLSVKYRLYEISSEASFSRLWLPAMTLGIISAPPLIRMIRANMLSEFGQIYIVSALSRGLTRRYIILHALRNTLMPIITMIALTFASLIGGSIIIESVFSYPGIGNYVINSILRHDYPVIQGYAAIMVLVVIVINVSVDLMYAILNPQAFHKGDVK